MTKHCVYNQKKKNRSCFLMQVLDLISYLLLSTPAEGKRICFLWGQFLNIVADQKKMGKKVMCPTIHCWENVLEIKINLPSDPAILLLGIYYREMKTYFTLRPVCKYS